MEIYVHIPFCKKKCNYCDFCSQPLGAETEYLRALKDEIKIAGELFAEKSVETLYVGGGTPSVLKSGMLGEIVSELERSFKMQTVERSIEGNPESLTSEKLAEIKDCGFDRLSIGVQSLNDAELKAAGRLHDSATALKTIAEAVKRFGNVSADMMLGLPEQTLQSALSTAKALIGSGIKHVSCYALKLEEGTPFFSIVKKGEMELPSEDECADMFDAVLNKMETNGFYRYEVSNFARNGFECKHNIGYWKREEYLGLGAAAHSFVNEKRFFNIPNVKGYIEYVEKLKSGETKFAENAEKILPKDARFEKIMLGLRMTEGLKAQYFQGYESALDKFKEYFLRMKNGNVALTKRGFEVMNTVLCGFLE